ncbi:MAG: winged helix DNA-binding domain-containing protein [Myxococcales bacterium]
MVPPEKRLPARRLLSQRIASSAPSTPAQLVAHLLAVQAQAPNAARWAVGLRTGTSEAQVQQALAEGAVLRTHAMRATWQLVCPADLRWIVALVAPRLLALAKRRFEELALPPRTLLRCWGVLEKALDESGELTRQEISERLARARLPATGTALAYVLVFAELDQRICSGADRGKQATYALLDRRAPGLRPPLPRDEALALLALRYFQSRGPATVADLAWWAGLTAADARAGLAGVRRQLVSTTVGGTEYWQDPESAEVDSLGDARAFLLPAFDEYLIAYQNRDAVLDPAYVKRVNAGGGLLSPCVVVAGRVVGLWRSELARGQACIRVDPFVPFSAKDRRAVELAAKRFGTFLGADVLTTFSARHA